MTERGTTYAPWQDRFTAEMNMAASHLKAAQLAYENGRGKKEIEEHFRRARQCMREAIKCTTH